MARCCSRARTCLSLPNSCGQNLTRCILLFAGVLSSHPIVSLRLNLFPLPSFLEMRKVEHCELRWTPSAVALGVHTYQFTALALNIPSSSSSPPLLPPLSSSLPLPLSFLPLLPPLPASCPPFFSFPLLPSHSLPQGKEGKKGRGEDQRKRGEEWREKGGGEGEREEREGDESEGQRWVRGGRERRGRRGRNREREERGRDGGSGTGEKEREGE